MADTEAKSRSLSDYASHLRTVHFTLLVTCAVLLATSLTRVRSDAEYALDQLDQVASVCDQLQWDPRWLEDQVEIESSNPEIFGIRSDLTATHQFADPAVRFKLAGPFWTLHPSDLPLVSSEQENNREQFFPYASDRRPLILDRPANIADFRQLWDALMKPVPVYVPVRLGTQAFVYPIGEAQRGPGGNRAERAARGVPMRPTRIRVQEVQVQRAEQGASVDTTLTLDTPDPADQKHVESLQTGHVFVGATRPPGVEYRIIIPTARETRHLLQDGQELFVRAYGLQWESGPFSHIFHELHAASGDIDQMSFERTRALLELARRRTGDRYEFFGIEVPTGEVLRWGLCGLLIVQLYLWLHLSAFRRELARAHGELDVAWIGLYRDGPSRVVTLLSAVVVPLGVSLYLTVASVAGSEGIGGRLFGIVVFSGTVVLCELVRREFRGLWSAGAERQVQPPVVVPRASEQAKE